MPNTFLQENDVIRITSSSCNNYNINTIKSQTFFFWPKNKGPLTLSKFFPYLLFFPSTKFWSNYIAWLYIKRTKLHTKGLFDLLSPIPFRLISTLPLWSFLSDSSLSHPLIQKLHSFCYKIHISTLLHLSYKVTLHRQQHNTHTTTHHHPLHTIYLSLIFNILKLHHLAAQRHIFISFFISHTKPPS